MRLRHIQWPIQTWQRLKGTALTVSAAVGVVVVLTDFIRWQWLLLLFPLLYLLWEKLFISVHQALRPKPDWDLRRTMIYLNDRHLPRYNGGKVKEAEDAIGQGSEALRKLEQAVSNGYIKMWIRSSDTGPKYMLPRHVIRDFEVEDLSVLFGVSRIVKEKIGPDGRPIPEQIKVKFVLRNNDTLRANYLTEGKADVRVGVDPHFSSIQVVREWPPRDWWRAWRR